MNLTDIARLTQMIEPEAKALGFDLVRVKLYGRSEVGDEEHTLQIMAEDPTTGQLLIEQCAALSRRISDAIDAVEASGAELIEGAYRLEVSSPGIDRPLTRPKDYTQWAGHEARISLIEPIASDAGANRKALHGDLIGLDGDAVILDDKKSGRVSVALANVHSAKLVLTNRLIAAAKPLDATGADSHEIDPEPDHHEAHEAPHEAQEA